MIEFNMFGVFLVFVFHAAAMIVLSPSKYSKTKTLAVWGVVTVVSVAGSLALLQRHPNFGSASIIFYVAAALFVATVFFLSRNAFYLTLFLVFAYMQSFLVALFLSGFLAQWVFPGQRYAAMFIRSALQLVVVLVCVLIRKKVDALSRGITKGWWPLNLLSLLMLSYLVVLTLHTYSTGFSQQTECVSVFLLIATLIAVYAVFFHTIRFMYSAAEKQQAELQSQFLLRQVQTMQESVEEAKRIRHDARHHNLQIQEYLQQKEYDALMRYLGDYEQDAERNTMVSLCENLAANSILCAYARKAEQNGIAVHLDVMLERDAPISDIDLVSILANLMENAIYGCLRAQTPRPTIDVSIGRKMKKLVIYVRNTAREDVEFENGLPKSDTGGGVGVTSILHSAARYAGECNFRNENGYFSCVILLKVPFAPSKGK